MSAKDHRFPNCQSARTRTRRHAAALGPCAVEHNTRAECAGAAHTRRHVMVRHHTPHSKHSRRSAIVAPRLLWVAPLTHSLAHGPLLSFSAPPTPPRPLAAAADLVREELDAVHVLVLALAVLAPVDVVAGGLGAHALDEGGVGPALGHAVLGGVLVLVAPAELLNAEGVLHLDAPRLGAAHARGLALCACPRACATCAGGGRGTFALHDRPVCAVEAACAAACRRRHGR
mmetsp:Transcript_38673/g.107438  ORF Transcript_38673/g.107438 Transcript_38673/m.107438 type:complete len:230 (-) Transcript_38673:56-745(-)